jgi:uncharacterized membrane protein HdeD (DUF308 family)
MTIWQRIKNILTALMLIGLALVLAFANTFNFNALADIPELDPETAEFIRTADFNMISYQIVLLILSVILLAYGIRQIHFYFSMARYMNGGRSSLYRGILFLDLALISFSFQSVPVTYIMAYLIGLMAFSGAIDVFGALDARKIHGHWKLKLLRGIVSIAFAFHAFLHLSTPRHCVYIYCLSLLYNALMHIISAFRRNDMIAIQ